ncbi:uncharacterized protein EKO05_0002712 [Ascochyta rabiei]|uniref:Uncharacterized protein n=1 Tax=Didymella rabiei TaxID=5454 RepID=A0A163GM63_DIDRA|nr:uncharacterized protein EKO05_0002712 [Ascochyta rabiei]KZM24916.1 hypothetical protein ST47_g3959 [Ascochyta rabiei]UPX12145.1 hypothetical protein EKO05_0002712 [Ascochyta rabiei]
MHRALLLPEVVAAIIRSGKTEAGLLHNCLLVNRTFSFEACRILWKGCYGIFGVGHVTPTISILANMVLREGIGRSRAQYYANFIRVLVFQEDHKADDATWHPQLRKLQFPLLEDLNIWKTRAAEEFNTEENILHYVHPGLRDLRVDASGPLSDFFLKEISRLCPHLQQLDIDFKNVTITKKGLASFLRKMSSLEGLHVAALDGSWSAEALAAVSVYDRLQLLHVPSTPEPWFNTVDTVSSSPYFPALKYFYCLDTTGKALVRLHSLNPRLEALHIYNGNLQGSDDVLSACAQFSQLVKFRYQPEKDAQITGHTLLKLAQCCPLLTSLSIGQDQAVPPIATDITDSIVSLIAENLLNLKELYLIFETTLPPGIATTLSSLSKNCNKLERLEISCGSDWQSITLLPKKALFPNLWTITLRPHLHMENFLTKADFDQLFGYFQTHAAEWFPKVEYFTIDEADSWEQELNDHMYAVGYKREYGSEVASNDGNDERNRDVDYDRDAFEEKEMKDLKG